MLWEKGFSVGEVRARYGGKPDYRYWDVGERRRVMKEKAGDLVSFDSGDWRIPVVHGDDEESSIERWVEQLARVARPRWGEVGFPAYEFAAMLHYAANGMPVSMAMKAAGLPVNMVTRYCKMEPRLDTLLRRASAMAAAPLLEKISASQDWRAAAWLLERGVAREDFKEERNEAQNKISIEINVVRDEKIVSDAGIVDITNDAMVLGLPSESKTEDISRG